MLLALLQLHQAWPTWRVTSSVWAGSFHHTFAAAGDPAVSIFSMSPYQLQQKTCASKQAHTCTPRQLSILLLGREDTGNRHAWPRAFAEVESGHCTQFAAMACVIERSPWHL